MKLERREFMKTGAMVAVVSKGEAPAAQEHGMDALSDRVSDLGPIPGREYASRIENASRLLKELGFGALFLEGSSSLEYFTGVRWGRSERTFGAVIPVEGKTTFVCPAFERDRAMEQMDPDVSEIRVWNEHESPFELVAGILSDWKLRSTKVAIEPTTRHFIVSGLGKAAPTAGFDNGQDVTDGCRMLKSDLELTYMRRANAITKTAFRTALQGLREGMTAEDLNQLISKAHSRMGVRGGALVLFGPASAYPHGTRERHELREGDVVLIDGGCSVRGYRSDVTRTTVFGRPSAKQQKIWDIVREAQEAALAAARPGLACGDLDRIARKVIEDAGYGPDYRFFKHRLGHGIGMDGHEAPYLVRDNPLILKPGMTFSDEPGIYIPGEFGIRHEDVMVITQDGAEFMGPKTRTIQDPV